MKNKIYICETCLKEIIDYPKVIRKYCDRECFYKRPNHWNKGKVQPPEVREKIRNTMKIKGILPPLTPKGTHNSPNTEFKKGHKLSFKRREKQREIAKSKKFGQWMKGRIPAFIYQGKHNHPSKDKHPNWKGGITPINDRIRDSDEYKEWRRDVFVRDQFTCQFCGHKFINIVAHHVKSFSDYPNLRFNVDNGQTLCRSCHVKIHKPSKKVIVGSFK